ncbi:beta-ketoacyl-ACP synthase III [Acidocella aminolytica]|uniref:Beta-ketoacyl-[acyl-carrier-protein] synthase III n=1 Tax=Acidocella aminolytica 101 = DSM 11237 TaxID=1120923 RepID=A0A0D6PBS5_9PROT|nr:beta-ketoacyl-ACP synthase III [Acidocella aminolytica]GAN78653.1 3-oxoacyl-(acyl carrier protein) synthase III [Acidocella aminolytica 101 = DSM 11237]GBQ36729.1 3-oxoacyl-ACP synthase [Acidocella aminolytica 101 = DSM 11237]SHE44433.1 3-oxoacyl-[acyl-carrier-protein] synthase III [Acidocella aminolytica 101 = DSM 11237]
MADQPTLKRAVLTGIGAYLPAQILTNEDMAKRVDTSDEWITERTGIKQRHFAASHETAAYMGAEAGRKALEQAGLAPEALGAIIVATSTPDQAFPSTAVHIQAALGAKSAFGFDLAAACSGFIYGLSVADAVLRAGQVKSVLVIGSEVYSRILNFEDRGTCVLFGDGAGAVLLEAREVEKSGPGLLSTHLHADGTLADILYVDGAVGQKDKPGHLVMHGREVFRHAVNLLAGAVNEALAENNLAASDIDLLVPHQANRRIIDGVGKKLGLPPERVVVTVDKHANTSAASIPLALACAMEEGRTKPGQLLLLEALGGGLTWGAALLRL